MSAGRKETIIAGVAGIVPVTWLALKLDDKSSLAPAESSLEFILDDEEGFRWAGKYDITANELLSVKKTQNKI